MSSFASAVPIGLKFVSMAAKKAAGSIRLRTLGIAPMVYQRLELSCFQEYHAPQGEQRVVELGQVGVQVLMEDACPTRHEGSSWYEQQMQDDDTYGEE